MAPPFLILALDKSVVTFTPLTFYTPGKSPPPPHGIYCIGGWVGSRTCLGLWGKEQLGPYLESNPGDPASRYTD
jgi:hypothetical protein